MDRGCLGSHILLGLFPSENSSQFNQKYPNLKLRKVLLSAVNFLAHIEFLINLGA